MKVVYVSTIPRGGPVSHLEYLLPHVAARGVEVRLVCATKSVADSFRRLGVEATVHPLRHKLDLEGARRLGPLLDADVVHTHDRRGGLLVRPQARLRGAAAVHTMHGVPEAIAVGLGRDSLIPPPDVSRAQFAWLLHGYMRLESALARLGQVVVPSEAMARFLAQRGLARGRVRVIRSGIDVRRQEASTTAGPVTIGTAANLEYWKGVDVLLDACAARDSMRIEIYGDGTDRPALERQAAALELDAGFHGFVDDLRQRLERLDIFVLPSRGDNFPIAVLEAMASAVPVVATRVGGVPELVVDGETGLLVDPDDPKELGDSIERLAGDAELRRRLGRNAAKRIADEFDPTDTAARFVALYEELLAGKG
jgi:glycosyltransferase involved in cell wall biosynthesis